MPRILWSMHALGREGLPPAIEVAGRRYRLLRTIKHDFFAATGFYTSSPAPDASEPDAVVKINRRRSFFGFPMRWIGRFLARREIRAYTTLADLPEVPELLGTVTDTGLAHAFAPGAPLSKESAVPDGFFPALMRTIDELHRRGIAYVDTNKPQNIILTPEGEPRLIDFQISYDLRMLRPRWLSRKILDACHRADVYHVLKNKRRFRPDQLTQDDLRRLERRGFWISLHRTLTKPYFWVRRPLMRWLKRSGRVADSGSD